MGQGTSTIKLIATEHPHLTKLSVSSISCGPSHTLVLTTAGQLYSFGSNERGQLGHGDTIPRYVPTLVSSVQTLNITGHSANGMHSVIVDVKGETRTFGKNDIGQLCHGAYNDATTPWPIRRGPEFVVQVAAGSYHILMLTRTNQLYGCGSNREGALGLGATVNSNMPTLLTGFVGLTILNIAGGDQFSLVLAYTDSPVNSTLYVCGGNAVCYFISHVSMVSWELDTPVDRPM